MSRLPVVGSDDGTWGDVLNDYLSQEHQADGKHKYDSIIKSGLDSAKPAAASANAGMVYFSTDVSGGTLYRSNGSSWVQVANGLTQAPTAHQSSHQSGGGDALTGNVDATARTMVRKNSGADIGARRRLNLIEGTNVTLTVADDSGSEEVDITIASTSNVTDSFSRVYNVEKSPYNASPDIYIKDAYVEETSPGNGIWKLLKSDSNPFQSGDAGKYVVLERAGVGTYRPHHTTIASYDGPGQVTLTAAIGSAPTNRPAWQTSQKKGRLTLSRNGDQTSAIQSAIDAALNAGGGIVYLPGVGYQITTLVMKSHVWLEGAGVRGTLLHQSASVNQPAIKVYVIDEEEAQLYAIRNLTVDGNGSNQANATLTLGAAYTAGDTTITLATGTGSNALEAGSLLHSGTGNRLFYTSKIGDTLYGVTGGAENTTDQNIANSQTLTHYRPAGILIVGAPPGDQPDYSYDNYDPHWLVEHVHVRNTRGDGVATFAQTGGLIQDVWVYSVWEIGLRCSYDMYVSNVCIEGSGRAGIFSRSSEIRMIGCKVFNAGGITATEGFGYLIEAPSQPYEGGVLMIGCNAQDNRAHGFYLRNTDRVHLKGCSAHSNGYSGTDKAGSGASDGTYVGVKMEGVNHSLVDISSTDSGHNGGTYQVNAIEIDSNSNYNQVTITHGRGSQSVASADFERVIKSTSSLSGGNNIVINSMGGSINPSYASPYTPDPYQATTHIMTLTGNLTVNAPLRGHLGTRLKFLLSQDGTGGRSITWNSAFVLNGWRANEAASAKSEVEFIYDGTNWVSTVAQTVIGISSNASANNTTSGVAISGLQADNVGAGRYHFRYVIKYQSTSTGVGVKFGVNHTGASSALIASAFWPTSGTTAAAATDIADQVATAGQLWEQSSTRSMTTTAPDLGPFTGGVDTANADCLVIIEGLLTVTNNGNLELYHGSETATNTQVMAGSCLFLTKVT